MEDSSTTGIPILNLLLECRWARHQLHAGRKEVAVASILMKSLSTLGGGPGKAERRWWRSQHSMADSSTTGKPILNLSPECRSVRGQLLACIRYVSVASILMKSLPTLGGVLEGLRGDAGDPRTQWQIPPQLIYQFWIRHLDVIGLDASYMLVEGMSLSHQYSWRLPTLPRAVFKNSNTQAILNSMADFSTTEGPILNLSPGGHWAWCQLHDGMRYVSNALVFMEFALLLRMVFCFY